MNTEDLRTEYLKDKGVAYRSAKSGEIRFTENYTLWLEKKLIKNLIIPVVSQRSELLQALKDVTRCCDGNEPKHEQIYHIANDAVEACDCG